MSTSLISARKRLQQLPQLLIECSAEASAYSKCVVTKDNLKLNDCVGEFNALRNCITAKSEGI